MPGRPRHLRFATTNVRQPIASAAGRGGRQDRLFYSFNLDDHVPRSHLLRGIDRFFDLSELRHLAPFYSHTGRPSIDPELMIRMLIALSFSRESSRLMARSYVVGRSNQSLSDLESLVTRSVAARRPARASIPVVGVAEIAFDAVQPSVDPGAFGVVLRLCELVRGLPVAAQAVPDGAQHRRRKRRRLLAIEAGDERIDRVGHGPSRS